MTMLLAQSLIEVDVAKNGLHLRKIEVWIFPGRQLDSPLYSPVALKNDVHEARLRDGVAHLLQQFTQPHGSVDVFVRVVSLSRARDRLGLLRGVNGVVGDLQLV